MYLRLLWAPYCRRQYGLYRPISLSLNTGFIALFRYRSIRALLFRPFAHLRRQRRHAGFGNVPEYAPSPRGLASLYLHQMGEKSLFESPYFAIAQYGLFIALFRYRSIRALARLCARFTPRIRRAILGRSNDIARVGDKATALTFSIETS